VAFTDYDPVLVEPFDPYDRDHGSYSQSRFSERFVHQSWPYNGAKSNSVYRYRGADRDEPWRFNDRDLALRRRINGLKSQCDT